MKSPHYKIPKLPAVLCLFLLQGLFYSASAQAPFAVPYQGVARNGVGAIIPSQPISLRFSIHDTSATGTVVYKETQSVTTSAFGLFNVNIGSGTPVTGTLAEVKWANSAKFLQVELDPAGGSTYTDMGTTQLNSVPYALYANNSGDWVYDSASTRLYLKKALQINDTIYFDTLHHKMLFADKAIYTNSQGLDIPAVNFGSKYTFKTTASKSADSTSANSNTLGIFYEVNNASNQFAGGYTGLFGVTTINPTATQKDVAYGINYSTIHAGQDTCFQLTGILNNTYNAGVGETDLVYGILNQTRMGNGSTGNVGSMYGIFNTMTKSGTAAGRITGNLYGYFGPFGGSIGSRVNGSAYGIYLQGMVGAAIGNFAIYTNQGRNRFGDSVLVSTAATVPRAFFDINNTSSMIIPAGTTAQRPVTGVAGMLRYNSDNGGVVEYNTGTGWYGTIRRVISIDIPLISAGTGFTQSLSVTGAVVGSTVSISPTTALNDGLIISWARVSAVNTVEVRFNLLYGAAIDPVGQNFYITVTQVQ